MPKVVTLGEFCAYAAQQQRAIGSVYKEIDEVQCQFNEIHRQTLQAWQAAISKAMPMLADKAALPEQLAQSLLRVEREEQAKLEKEIAGLAADVESRRAEADKTIAEAQAELKALRQTNPQLDAAEEAIKARRAEIAEAIRQLDAEIKATPWLTGVFRRRRLGRQRGQEQADLASATGRLRQVREQWQEEKRRFEAGQGRLRNQWESLSTEAAQMQARLDYLRANLAALSREKGAVRYLAELQSVPEAPEPLHAALAAMVEPNQAKAEYEEGLRTAAEALGLLKGLAEGMDRFCRSAEKVHGEQRQYNLRELHVELADAVLAFHALWPELQAQVRDEKTRGTHPAEFSRCVRLAITGRLGNQAIAAMFESLGNALSQATKAWG